MLSSFFSYKRVKQWNLVKKQTVKKLSLKPLFYLNCMFPEEDEKSHNHTSFRLPLDTLFMLIMS